MHSIFSSIISKGKQVIVATDQRAKSVAADIYVDVRMLYSICANGFGGGLVWLKWKLRKTLVNHCRSSKMAQHSKPDKYIDVDATQLKPSPNRVRNILTLEERVAAIEAYYCRPMYTKVARMFNCSWEQIKNIIANREAIMKFYEATRKQRPQEDESDINLDVKQKKLRFLGECIYEYIQRVQFHARVDITEELLRTKALEFRDILVLNDFYPSKTWINHFKATYNISLSNRQIALTRVPPSSLDLKDIMTYCTKNKPNNPSLIEIRELQQNLGKEQMGTSVDTTIEELEEERRARKLNFLEKALAEYVLRAKFHHKMTNANPMTNCQKPISNHSPGHWSEYSNDEDEDEELPRQVRNTKDALRLLKPLEEYAMLKENYRAIGLIAQLEEILKNTQTNPTEKEYET
uniref:HTH CENPB-type domain-containing protein n=1 Tax=Glossina pallidipes TaxID=7398 RepID=A0A1A9ZMN9_GLOPL